jgi:hypothetical protein
MSPNPVNLIAWSRPMAQPVQKGGGFLGPQSNTCRSRHDPSRTWRAEADHNGFRWFACICINGARCGSLSIWFGTGSVPDVRLIFCFFDEFWPTRESFGLARGRRFGSPGGDSGPQGGAFEGILDPSKIIKDTHIYIYIWRRPTSPLREV